MRVLVASHPYSASYGGGERYLEALVEGLRPHGFAFELFSSSIPLLEIFSQRGLRARRSKIGPEPVSKWALPLFILFSPVLFLMMFTRLLRSRPNVVICLSLTDKLLATLPAKWLKSKVIWVEHLVPSRSLTENPLLNTYVKLSHFASIVTVSQAVIDGLVKLGVPKERIEMIPPGVEIPTGAAKLTSETVGVVARLSPEKNVALAIRAFKHLAVEMPKAELHIFGAGPEKKRLENLATQLGIADRIHWRGFTSDPEMLYAGLRVLAVPSKAESFGIAALEAMSWGVPVVATNVGGLPELVQDGLSGLIAPSDDDIAFAAALRQLLKNRELATKFGRASRIAAQKYSLERNLAAWEKLLKA